MSPVIEGRGRHLKVCSSGGVLQQGLIQSGWNLLRLLSLGVRFWYQLFLWSPSCSKPTSAWALEHVAPRNFVEFFVTWSWWGQWLLCTFPSDLHHFVYSMVVCTVMFHDITGSLECLKLIFLMFYWSIKRKFKINYFQSWNHFQIWGCQEKAKIPVNSCLNCFPWSKICPL